MRKGARSITTCAILLALIVVGGFIRIPVGAVPITLQTLFVLLAGGIGGKRIGALAVVIYIAMGLIGIPIFSGGGGITYVLYPTFGYLIGFIFAALIAGVAKSGFKKRLVCNLIGVVVIHLIGVWYFYFAANFALQFRDALMQTIADNPIYAGAEVGLWQAFLTGSLIFLPIDIISAIISALIANKVYPLINK